MSARDDILNALRQASRYPAADAPKQYMEVVAMAPDADLTAKFIAECKRHLAEVYTVGTWGEAWEKVSELLRGFRAKTAFTWDEDQFQAPGLQWALAGAGCERVGSPHPNPPPQAGEGEQTAHYSPERAAQAAADAGITGVQSAIAATGSLVLISGQGRPRAASLVPPRHIALVGRSQILRSVEAWVASKPPIEASANVTFITGPSRSADIEMIVTLGVHGPGEVHVVLVED